MSKPKKAIDKEDSRRIRIQIRHVLLEVWDPIGIADEPNAQDEYDSYVGPICDLIITGATDSNLIEYLYRVTNDRMGLMAKESALLNTVEALRNIPLSPAQS